MKVKFKKMHESAIIPKFGHDDSSNAGFDMYACLRTHFETPLDFVRLLPGQSERIPLGVAWEPSMTGPKKKVVMILKGRSGLAVRRIEVSNAGVIDEGYRGEISAILYNKSNVPFTIKNGDRIIQGVVVALPDVEIVEVDELGDSKRGEKGFGSSGV